MRSAQTGTIALAQPLNRFFRTFGAKKRPADVTYLMDG
jgi:hypothetical protein